MEAIKVLNQENESSDVSVRPLQENDLSAADHIMPPTTEATHARV